MMDDFEAYRLAEARAFVARYPSCRVERVGKLTLVSIGAEVSRAQLEAIAHSMNEQATSVQQDETFAA